MQTHVDKNVHEKLSVKHFSRFHFLSFTSAMLKCFGDIERSCFNLVWIILHCIAILIEIFSMCVIFYGAGICAAPAFATFSFDITKVNCFSCIRPNGFYILAPSNIFKFYGFLFLFGMINWKQRRTKILISSQLSLCLKGNHVFWALNLQLWRTGLSQLHHHPGHVT